MLTQSLYAANYELEILDEYEYQTLNIHPGSVSGTLWSSIENTLSHEKIDDSLFSEFNELDSAFITPQIESVIEDQTEDYQQMNPEVDILESNETYTELGTEIEIIPEVNVTTSDSFTESELDVSPPYVPESELESSPEPEIEPESEEPVAPSAETALESLSRGFFRFMTKATALLPFAQESIIEESVTDEPLRPVEPEFDNDPLSVEQGEVNIEDTQSTDEAIDAAPLLIPDGVLREQEETPPGEEIVVEDYNTPEAISEPLPPCAGSFCATPMLEFRDFTVGENFDDQHITNMQLRVSLAGMPHQNATPGGHLRIEYEHYDFWMDGGIIPLDGEVSNALNGGYFLFGFPLYSDWDELKRIKVRISYIGDMEHLPEIYIDSVWLEIESIHNNALIDPESMPHGDEKPYREPDVRKETPEGYTFDFRSLRTEWEHDENPRFDFVVEREVQPRGLFKRMAEEVFSLLGFDDEESEEDDLSVRVVNDEWKNIVEVTEGENGYSLELPKLRQFKPGKHIITLEIKDGGTTFFIDQEFTWGVLALNADKSIYLPGERAYLQMGVLDDLGHTICDAALALEVRTPNGTIANLSTDGGEIRYGDECVGDTFTTSPDYDAYFNMNDGIGAYELTLTAVTHNGTHTISDTIEVRESVPFDITRTGPTRIFPPAPYPVTLSVTANESYQGEIVEYVPVSFQVYEDDAYPTFRTHEVGDAKQLIWDVDLSEGETIELGYTFDAPDVSPEFYLLGPLTIGAFTEIREWQIASDAPDNARIVQSVLGTEVSATTYSATFGSAPTAGNTIIMVAMHRDGPSAFNVPENLTQAVLSNAALEIDIGIWYGSANPASTTYSITKTGGNQTGIVYLLEVYGLATSSLLNATSSNDQTGATGLIASTGLTPPTTAYAFALAAVGVGDNDFTDPTSASWTSSSSAPYTQLSWNQWATGNDGGLGIAYANVRAAESQQGRLTLTTGGVEERNSVIAVFRTLSQYTTVGSRGNQTAELKLNTQHNNMGGVFTLTPNTGSTSVTSITITENGTTDAQADLSNIRLRYEFDTTAPYDCASATYDGTEVQYGATSSAFSAPNGTATFNGSVSVATTSALCVFTLLDVDASATPGDTIELEISTPNTQVIMDQGTSTPGTSVALSDTTTIVIGYAPSAPLFTDSPAFNNMKSTTTQPTLGGFVSTDRDGDLLEYQIIIDDDYNLTSPATTTYSFNYPGDAGWASTTFASGATTTYRIQDANLLTPGQTYWWAVRARDPANTNTWSATSTRYSFTVSNAIAVPEWFQTVDMQFATSATTSNATTTGNGSVEIVNLDTTVTLLNAWSTGNTKTISAGSDRILVVAIVSEDNGIDVNVNTVTYGGQTLTEITDQQIGTGFSNGMWVGYLTEADIALAAGTTITPTWVGGTPGSGILYASAVFSNANQTSPIRGYSANALTSGTDISPSASTTVIKGDMMFYISETATGLTHTPSSGYTEGTEEDTGGVGFVTASAYKSITTDGTEFPTAAWSGSGNRLLMVAASIAPVPAKGIVTSNIVDFDWVSGQSDWGEVAWNLTEPSGYNSRLQLLYASSSSSTCTTLVPNSALTGNTVGFTATASPLDISGLSTSTYNRICVRMNLDEGSGTTSPTLDDWTVRWDRTSVLTQAAYWWYAYSTTTTPADTWPPGATAFELLENEPVISSNPVDYGDVLRLRMGVGASSVNASSRTFKLQYASDVNEDGCSADLGWNDVGGTSSSTATWRGYDISGLTDGATLAADLLSSSSVLETYEEANDSNVMPNSITISSQGEWEWVVEHRALAETNYCFRMVSADGSELNQYTEYPRLITNASPVVLALNTPFDNERVASTSPWFEFLASDIEANEVDYQIQIDNNADFSSTIIDTNSSSNLTDFTNIDNLPDKSPFFEINTIRYVIPSSLTNGQTYWWRVRSTDPNGSAAYGEWSSGQSFTVTTGTAVSTWYQTTEEQFDTGSLVGTDATASDNVTFASGSTTGTTTSTSIDFESGEIGNAWGEFLFTETGGAGTILYHIEYNNGGSWELVPDIDLSGNSAGYDTSPVSLIDLNTEIYNEIRLRANFTSGSPTLEDWEVTWGYRIGVVTHLSLFDNEKTGTTTPTFTFMTTDPEDDDLEYQFSWSTDRTYVTGSTTVNSSTSPGFSNLTTGIDTNPFNSGETIRYTMQSGLTNNETYWWRARARDPNGGGSYSFWSEPWSFTVDTTATTSTWFQTTEEQFETDTLLSVYASTSDSVLVTPAGVTTYTFSGITNPSGTHIARDFEVDVDDPTDPPTADEIDTITTNGTAAGIPNLRTAIAGYASDAEATDVQYTALGASDDSRWQITDPGAGDNAVFWTSFLINENSADINEIAILVEGYQAVATDKAWLGVWRPGSSTPYWQRLTDSTQTSDFNYTGSITSNIDQYLDASNRLHIMLFNEDDSDSLFIDYIEVEVTTDAAVSGTVTGTPIDFDDGSGPIWGQLLWTDSEPGLSSITYHLEYLTVGSTWATIPNAALSGNESGFTTSPVSLTGLNTSTYNEIRIVGTLDCFITTCPELRDWTLRWSPGFTISGTAFEYDGVSSSTSGTVAVAVNGELQIGKTGSIVNGAWSISNVTVFDGDVITVFVDGATDADEAVAVTVYDGIPDISGLTLQKRHLTIGSNDEETITNAHIGEYDYTDDEDLFYDVNGTNDLTMCADVDCSDAGIVILARNAYVPGTGGDVVTHDFRNNGTFTSGANTIRVSGSWDNNATTTMTGSTVIFTATTTTETVDSGGALSPSFNNVTFGETSGTATWSLASGLDVNGNLAVTYGTLARNTATITIATNLTTAAGGFWSGIGTTTFDGSNPTTWTDQNTVRQNIGHVVVDGTTKSLFLGSSTTMQSLLVGADDTFDVTTSNHAASVYLDWNVLGTFTARSGTVNFLATTTNRTITAGGDAFYTVHFNGAGGAWFFSEANLSVLNDFVIATGTVTLPTGTTTIAGSFTNTGGTFAHNNATVQMTGSGTKTLTLSGTPFTNAFYNLRFAGSGSFSFTEANATTSNDLRITQGTVTFPSNTLTVLGHFENTSGTFNANSGTVRFSGSEPKIIDTNSSFYNLLFTRSTSTTFIDTNVTVFEDFTVTAGEVILPTGTLTIGGSIANTGALTHGGGTVLMNSTDSGETISLGTSQLHNLTINGTTGGFTILTHATTTGAVTLTNADTFTLTSGQTMAVGGTFTNSIGGASTTWTGSTLSLEAGTYSVNTKTNTGDTYETLRIKPGAHIALWNSSATTYDIDTTASLYSEDHAGQDGDLYIFGSYARTSGTEYWSYATDFDGTALATTSRQVDVRLASGASVILTGSALSVVGTTTGTTTVANQGSGVYTVSVAGGTTSAQYYDFTDLGASGLSLLGGNSVTSLENGRFVPSVEAGTGITVSSSTIDANPGLQIYRVNFSTTTVISATNVTQVGGAPSSYWWFRNSTGTISGEAFDSDTGDPGSIRWDDSSLSVTVSGTVFQADGVTTMGAPTCGVGTPVRIVVENGGTHNGACDGSGNFSIPGVTIVGDPTLTVFLNDAAGGERAVAVTKTPTGNVTGLDLMANRVIVRHEDTSAMTIDDMLAYDVSDDTDIPFTASTGTISVEPDFGLVVWAGKTFAPGGSVTLQSGGSGAAYDGTLYLRASSTFTGAGTTTYAIGGSWFQYASSTFIPASSTVLMIATTTGKTLTSSSSESIALNNLTFTGVGGGWNLNGNLTLTGNLTLSTGTLSGTGNVTLSNGSMSGDGLLSLGAGTTTLVASNSLGGTQAWTFANLVLGTGAMTGTTTKATTATTTVGGRLTIGTGHYFIPYGSLLHLTGSGTVFVENGTFVESTSTVRYGGTSGANVLSTTYHNLEVNASGASPTYVGTGLGIVVQNALTIGGTGNTTFTLDTNDPALDVNGALTIAPNGTLIASASGSFAAGGDWDNDGTFTGSGGMVTFDGSGTQTIAAGSSSWSTVVASSTGTLTLTEHSTTTGAFTISLADTFTVNSGIALAVGGTFRNNLGGADTVWTGSTLHLYGGGNYTINGSTTTDSYARLTIGSGTQIRMWNSDAGTYDLTTTASLYSQDHADVTGNLSIYGAYVKTSGADHWSYATDFDGTALGGGSRQVDVRIASGGSVLYTGGALAIIGDATASTTITNQGSGTYSMRIGGSASTTMSYYEFLNLDANGLVFSGTPNVVNISNGSYTVGTAGGTALTVGGTVITQNPARTFTANTFSTSTGGTLYNVTATGTTVSSWRFTNHSGALDGEAYDVDPDGDPGYIVWDDSAALLTISGHVFSDDGTATSTFCDGSSNMTLRVAGLTTYQTSCGIGTGSFTFTNVAYSPGDSFVVYIDDEPEKGATVSEDPVTNINNFDVYENRVIVRHEGADPLSITDMASWDSTDDTDIPFTAVDGTPDTLALPPNRKLIVWTGKEFEPNGNVTLTGAGGGSAYDGTLELQTNATFDATGAESHSIGGSLIMGIGATLDDDTSTLTFTTTGAARTVDSNDQSFYNLIFSGPGSWAITNTTLDIGNDLTITQGAVTLPSGTTTIAGSFQNTGGSFSQNSGRIAFISTGAETIRMGSGTFGTTTFSGGGSWTYQGGFASTTGDFTILSGTVSAPTGTLMIGGDFTNGGTFTHNSGTIRMTSSAASTTLHASSSDLGSVTIAGTGTFLFTDPVEALTGSLTFLSGTTTLPTTTISIGGSLVSSGGAFIHATGTILMNSADTGEFITPGNSTFNNLTIAAPSGGYTVTGSATTTGNFSLTSATAFTLQSGTSFGIGGIFTNLVGGAGTTWTGTTLNIQTGQNYTVNSKAAGGDVYNIINLGSNTDLRLWNSVATTTFSDTSSSLYSQNNAAVNGELYVYGDYSRTTGADYWSATTDFDGTAIASRAVTVRHQTGATSTFYGGTLEVVGSASATTTVTNQGSGTYALHILGGTLNAQYYAIRNIDAYGLVLNGTTTITSLNSGDFELTVSGGALMTVSSTTLNYNASAVISSVRFATTSAITGVNVALVGSTPSAWTFTNHRGNLDGETFDSDGIDDCGSVRWDDSTCLLTEQSAYRWRLDDGGEGVPDSEWFNQSWTKRKRVTITNLDATEYSNAVVEVPILYDSDMQVDFDDLRVMDASGITPLDFVREIYTASSDAVLWVEIPTLPASSAVELYVYYGNGSASYAGVGTTTFIAYDDFEDNNITEYSGETTLFAADTTFAYQGTYGLEVTNVTGRTTDGIYRSDASSTVSRGQTVRFLQYVDTGVGATDEVCTMFGVQANQNNNYAVCLEQVTGTDRMSLSRGVDDNDLSGTILASTTVAYTTGWYEVEIDWATTAIAVSLYKDDVLVATTSATDTTYTSGGFGYTYWFQNGGWDFYTARPLLLTEPTTTIGYEQVPGGANWAAARNAPYAGVTVGTVVRPRFLIENTGLTVSDAYRLMYASKGASPSCEAVSGGNYSAVPPQSSCGTSPICMETSTEFTNNDSTTDVLGGEGAFTSGEIIEDPSNTTNSLSIDPVEYTEVEYAIAITANASDAAYCLRVSDAGTAIDSYTRVAELGLVFAPNITSLTFNDGIDITLTPGGTTTVYATGTVTDQNGYTDIAYATTTMFRSAVTETCSADTNSCYIAGPSMCTYVNCSGNSCDIVCSADFYFHADPTDIGAYAGQTWRAELAVEDQAGYVATATAASIDLVTLRALTADSLINYGALAVNENTGSYNATTTFTNIGNDAIDVLIEGSNLTDGLASTIPVTEQLFATSTFTYSSCVYCTQLTASSTTYELDLTKPATTTPGITDEIYWGIEIPFGVSANSHTGTNVFYATGDN